MVFFNNMVKVKFFMKNLPEAELIESFMSIVVQSIESVDKRRNHLKWLLVREKVALSKST